MLDLEKRREGKGRRTHLVRVEDEDLEPASAQLLEDVDLARVGDGGDDDKAAALEVEGEVAAVGRVCAEDDDALLADLVGDAVLGRDEAEGPVLWVGEEGARDEADEEGREEAGRLLRVEGVGGCGREAECGDGVGPRVVCGVRGDGARPGRGPGGRWGRRRRRGRGRLREDGVWEPVARVGDALAEGELVDEVGPGG